jgi:hypothetical protein
MTDLVRHEIPELVLTLRNELKISAADLGELFTALARDYERINRGRILVVVHLEAGSLVAILQEIAPYAKMGLDLVRAAKNLKEFVLILWEFIRKAKDHPKESDLFRRKKSPGIRSAEKLLQIAINSCAEVEFERKSPDGEEIRFRVRPSDAMQIRKQAETPPPERPRNTKRLESGQPMIDAAADKLIAAGAPDSATAEAIVSALALALDDADVKGVLEAIAVRLNERGHYSLAAAVRAHLQPPSPSES